MKKNGKRKETESFKTIAGLGENALKKAVVQVPMGSGKRPGTEVGLPEDLRVMHAEEHNPHDG